MLLCLVVCLTLLASFFLSSHLSLKHAYTGICIFVLTKMYNKYSTCMPVTVVMRFTVWYGETKSKLLVLVPGLCITQQLEGTFAQHHTSTKNTPGSSDTYMYMYNNIYMYMYMCLGCAVLLCLVCLFDLSSFSSLI